MRPKIICHMVSSIDGKLLCSRWTPLADGSPFDTVSTLYESVADSLSADGWIVGRQTMQGFARGTPPASVDVGTSFSRTPFLGARKARRLAIVIDPSGKLHYDASGTATEHFVAILGKSVPDHYLAELRQKGVSYFFAGEAGEDLADAMATLAEVFNARLLLLEGGGVTNGHFLKAELIDEISLLIYPGIDGLAGVQSIFEYPGKEDERPANGKALRLLRAEQIDKGIMWLRYAVEVAP